MARNVRGWTRYTPSHSSWSDFSLKCDQATATNNGSVFQSTAPVDNYWPLHASDLRAVYGKDSSGFYKDSCVAMSQAGPLFTIGANFLDNEGNAYTVFGLRNERYRTRNFK